MLSEEKMRELPAKAQEFWRVAWAFIAKTQTEWAWIEADSDEFLAWRQYFQLKGWKPFAIKAIEKKTIKGMTMPAQWPEWFDSKYYKPLAAE